MSAGPVRVVVRYGHQAVGDVPDYHEWIYVAPIACDKRGRPNPRIAYPDWQFWRCNNPDCHAEAVVSDDAVRTLIEEAS